ncbi:hypothetical protein OSB04_015210 [Centaurea solstitialis]|uniref:Reverse transcriptase Ty1/copia-type domain-containing protein n=1 Tax=Centaurea solstitialis TaxID=347529 RepID=A0AA38WGB7_9ASTR|nr:hypothetical protein OSB04_015210 [Centaurea solstitialis]
MSVFGRGRRHVYRSKQPSLPPATAAVRTTTAAVVTRRTENAIVLTTTIGGVVDDGSSSDRHYHRRLSSHTISPPPPSQSTTAAPATVAVSIGVLTTNIAAATTIGGVAADTKNDGSSGRCHHHRRLPRLCGRESPPPRDCGGEFLFPINATITTYGGLVVLLLSPPRSATTASTIGGAVVFIVHSRNHKLWCGLCGCIDGKPPATTNGGYAGGCGDSVVAEVALIPLLGTVGTNGAQRYHRGSDTIYLILYVDDIILTASSPTLISMVISQLSSEFPMSDLGPLSFFLGIAASRSNSRLFLYQSTFAQEILARADMVLCNPCSTPIDTKTKLVADGERVPDPTLYRSLAGALQYLTFTRLDIAYAVQHICLFMHDPHLLHFNVLKRILQYLKGTLSHGLHIKASAVDRLVAYSDADWAGCPNTHRSTLGFCVYLGDNLVSWSSKRQHVVSRSSAEAEYRGIANVVAETAWL